MMKAWMESFWSPVLSWKADKSCVLISAKDCTTRSEDGVLDLVYTPWSYIDGFLTTFCPMRMRGTSYT